MGIVQVMVKKGITRNKTTLIPSIQGVHPELLKCPTVHGILLHVRNHIQWIDIFIDFSQVTGKLNLLHESEPWINFKTM